MRISPVTRITASTEIKMVRGEVIKKDGFSPYFTLFSSLLAFSPSLFCVISQIISIFAARNQKIYNHGRQKSNI